MGRQDEIGASQLKGEGNEGPRVGKTSIKGHFRAPKDGNLLL